MQGLKLARFTLAVKVPGTPPVGVNVYVMTADRCEELVENTSNVTVVLPAPTVNVVGLIPVVGAPLMLKASMCTVPAWLAVKVTTMR